MAEPTKVLTLRALVWLVLFLVGSSLMTGCVGGFVMCRGIDWGWGWISSWLGW